MTRKLLIFDRSAMSSPLIPSAKYSSSWLPERFSSGSTAIDRMGPPVVRPGQTRRPSAAAAAKPAINTAADTTTTRLERRREVSGRETVPEDDAASSAARTSAADWYRRPGSFARQRCTNGLECR